MEYLIIAGVASGLALLIATIWLVRGYLQRRVKLEVVDEGLSLKKNGSIRGAFLFKCVVKNNGRGRCSIMDVDIELPNNGQVIKGGVLNVSTGVGGHRGAKSTKLPVRVSGDGSIPISVVGRAEFKSPEYPSHGLVKMKIRGRKKPLVREFKVNDRYIITAHSFDS